MRIEICIVEFHDNESCKWYETARFKFVRCGFAHATETAKAI